MDIPNIKAAELREVKKPQSEQATFVLQKVIANIKRGTTIAHFPAAGVEGVNSNLCNYGHQGNSTIEWGSGTSILGNWSTELGEIFHEVLTQKGLRIAGDPKDMFGQRTSAQSAEYLIGARISKINPFDGAKSVQSGRRGAPRDVAFIGQAPQRTGGADLAHRRPGFRARRTLSCSACGHQDHGAKHAWPADAETQSNGSIIRAVGIMHRPE